MDGELGRSRTPHAVRRLRRTLWASVSFLAGFAVLIALLARFYILPALAAADHADPLRQRQLSAWATLLLVLMLMILLIGLAMTFRVRRFFFPRGAAIKRPLDLRDPWTESGRRHGQDEVNAPDSRSR